MLNLASLVAKEGEGALKHVYPRRSQAASAVPCLLISSDMLRSSLYSEPYHWLCS